MSNLDPSPATLEQVNDWGHKLIHALEHVPFFSDDLISYSDEIIPDCHVFQIKHDTLPDRILAIVWGCPTHVEGCTCTEPSVPTLNIKVMDSELGDVIPDAGTVEYEAPTTSQGLVAFTMFAVTLFHSTGTL